MINHLNIEITINTSRNESIRNTPIMDYAKAFGVKIEIGRDELESLIGDADSTQEVLNSVMHKIESDVLSEIRTALHQMIEGRKDGRENN